METSELLTIEQSKKYYPQGTHISTIIRHITRGIKTRGGAVVKLEATRMGARWTTTPEALERFRDRLTAAAGASPPAPAQGRSYARSMAHLESLGF